MPETARLCPRSLVISSCGNISTVLLHIHYQIPEKGLSSSSKQNMKTLSQSSYHWDSPCLSHTPASKEASCFSTFSEGLINTEMWTFSGKQGELAKFIYRTCTNNEQWILDYTWMLQLLDVIPHKASVNIFINTSNILIQTRNWTCIPNSLWGELWPLSKWSDVLVCAGQSRISSTFHTSCELSYLTLLSHWLDSQTQLWNRFFTV